MYYRFRGFEPEFDGRDLEMDKFDKLIGRDRGRLNAHLQVSALENACRYIEMCAHHEPLARLNKFYFTLLRLLTTHKEFWTFSHLPTKYHAPHSVENTIVLKISSNTSNTTVYIACSVAVIPVASWTNPVQGGLLLNKALLTWYFEIFRWIYSAWVLS
jgi:hypothetical protein